MEKLATSQTEASRSLPSGGDAPKRGVERREEARRREERRTHPRHKCDGGAEVRKQGVDARVWGTLTDISLGGCYVEMMTPFPSATVVEVTLEAGGERLRSGGLVRTSHAGCGMGVQFTEMSAEDRARLQRMVSSLADSGNKPSEPPHPVPVPPPEGSDGSPRQADRVLQGVLAFFGERDVLTRREFQEILRKAKSLSEPRGPSGQ